MANLRKEIDMFIAGEKNEKNCHKKSEMENLWIKCSKCGEILYRDEVVLNYNICYKCNGYFRLSAKDRIELITDVNSFEEWDEKLPINNPLDFPEYLQKVNELQYKIKLDEAVVTGKLKIYGISVAVCVCDSRFLMGSMGYTVGEKITRAVENATKEELPLIIFTCSGGARMQEGIVSLMQMAKTAAAIKKFKEAGLLYITVLTDPTTGGVTASFAMLGDVILAEPKALIGFAGPRVIEQTIGEKLPEYFQKAEFLLEKGFVDIIVERYDMKRTLYNIIDMSCRKNNTLKEVNYRSEKIIHYMNRTQISAWERVKIARAHDRPTAKDYINKLFTDFIELHGDRYFGDDGAILGGWANFCGMPIMVIGQQKGRSVKENSYRHFGMSNPEGYRKSLRLMKLAEKFGRPVINFIDTPGAFCGIEAEERGEGAAIANNLYEISALTVPVLSIIIGEGGSGGALALAVANEVWMLENSIYSILSPEGFASILWKDSKRAEEAAEIMKITASDLKELNIIDKIIPEPIVLNKINFNVVAEELQRDMFIFIEEFMVMDRKKIAEHRYEKYRGM